MKTHLKNIQEKIYTSTGKAKEQVARWQEQGEKIVFTNGCFDILHQGHIVYLSKTADYGNRLIIGLNTDDSVRRIKGKSRPIVSEQERALLLASLGFVDMVVFFREDTPYELIKALQPNVLTKGADYKAENIVGYDIVTQRGGNVETIVLEEGFSTTNVIEKIKKISRNG